jgi:hypothetical protein
MQKGVLYIYIYCLHKIQVVVPVVSGDLGGLLLKYVLQTALPSCSSAALVPLVEAVVALLLLLSAVELSAEVSADRLKLLELLSLMAFTTCIMRAKETRLVI